MRPADVDPDGAVYECFGCGSRVTEPETRLCAQCGATMQNICRPRDL